LKPPEPKTRSVALNRAFALSGLLLGALALGSLLVEHTALQAIAAITPQSLIEPSPAKVPTQPPSHCQIQGQEKSSTAPQDALAQVLRNLPQCPADVLVLRQELQKRGATFMTTLVANRGFHNASVGSFSLFESLTGTLQGVDFQLNPGMFFLGHFTAADKQILSLDQNPLSDNLMIELIAWDPSKGLFNFYELIGKGAQKGGWHYRGDSRDILADTESLHLPRPSGQSAFGNRLRCSGCHLAGGPIMKELTLPHNDWWLKTRPLPLAENKPDPTLSIFLSQLQNASVLSQHVQTGMLQLLNSPTYQGIPRSLQTQLRPLFCPEELNLESDSQPLAETGSEIEIPASALLDLRWQQKDLKVSTQAYLAALKQLKSRFPETELPDADHAWLSPVKAWSDQAAIDRLQQKGLIDEEFIADVLAVDLVRPVVSEQRCGLLQYVPTQWSPDWQAKLRQNLSRHTTPAALQLFRHLRDPSFNQQSHQAKAKQFLQACQQRLNSPEGLQDLLQFLAAQRLAISKSEISSNPRGQILEPGFRVIFPIWEMPKRLPQLNMACLPDE
jgi:hypothetical protein